VRALALLTAGGLTLAACGSSDGAATDTSSSVAPKVIVTSIAGDDESALFAAIYARVLEDAGYRVARKDPISLDRAGYLAALAAGDVNLVPDWTRDLVAHVYADEPGASTVESTSTTAAAATTSTSGSGSGPVSANGRSVPEQIVAIRAALPDGVSVGEPSIGEDKSSLACSQATMKANASNNVINLFGLSSIAPSVRLGGSAEWMADDEVGYPAFQRFYGGEFKDVLTIEDADLEAALDGDEVDCVAVESMDPIVTRAKLTVLLDDKAMVRGNAAVPLLSTSIATDDLITVLTQVNNALTANKINQLLNEINSNGTDPVTVANAFLDTAGSLTPSTSVAG
jgi:osmoprotectant transport system substrate-binding protein